MPQMKILIAFTPATGHLNPLLAIGHILLGHHVTFLSGSVFRDRIVAIGSSFHVFPAGADFDPSVPASVASELESITPGADCLRVAMERMFVDAVPAQHQGLQKVLQNFPADVVIGDDMLFGVLPTLLGPDAKRPPIVLCGTSFLHWCRGDGAPHFIGLPPAITQAQRDEYAQIYQAVRMDTSEDRCVRHDYGSVNRAISFGVPLICAGATEDKADVNARVAWSGVGIDLKANDPTPTALCEAVRTVMDAQDCRARVLQMAGEFRAIDTRSEVLRVVASTAGSCRQREPAGHTDSQACPASWQPSHAPCAATAPLECPQNPFDQVRRMTAR